MWHTSFFVPDDMCPLHFHFDSTLRDILTLKLVCSLSMTGDPLSKLPVLHKQAVLATMDEVSYSVLLNVLSLLSACKAKLISRYIH